MLSLFWLLLGGAIGAAAAQKKGFSMVGGVVGGMLLGPLAILMFAVSGVSSSKEQKKCPFYVLRLVAEVRWLRGLVKEASARLEALGKPRT